MTVPEAPAYFCLVDDLREPPAVETYTEGRVFVGEEELVCGAGNPEVQDGYIGRMDSHSESTVRRVLGRRKDFQEFDLPAARDRTETVSIEFGRVTDAESVDWPGSNLGGSDRTYGVRVDSPAFGDADLLIQFGRGWRNRGSGRDRHEAFARLVRAKADDVDSVVPDSTASVGGTAESPSSDGDADGLSWLTDEAESTAVVARNYTGTPTTVRVACRTDDGVRFRDDVTLDELGDERWTDLPEREPFEIGIVPEDGDSVVRGFDGTAEIEGDILVYVTPEEATIEVSTPETDVTEMPTKRSNPSDGATERAELSDEYSGTTRNATTLFNIGTRLKRRGRVLTVGLVVWFGSVAFDGQPQEMVAVFGFLLTIYGLYRLVRG